MTRSDAAHERLLSEPVRGLEDPRDLHPAPEGLFPDPGTPPASGILGIDPPDEPANRMSDEEPRGIVDPRIETIGPDL
jgi:hypothetical protein